MTNERTNGPTPIPHATEPRPDTGLRNGRLGLWLVVASEFMLVAGLVSAMVFLRLGSTDWPLNALEHGLPLVNTIVVLASALTAGLAARAVTRHDGEFRLLWTLTLALGGLVLFVRSAELSILIGMGRTPASHNLFGIYVVLALVHAAFLAGNLVVGAWILVTGRTLAAHDPARHRERVYGAVLHWMWLVVLWLVLMAAFFIG